MSYIDLTRKSLLSPYNETVCITKNECRVLLPCFEKIHKDILKKLEKYEDIHQGGEATESQETKRDTYSDQERYISNIIRNIKELISS